MANRIQVHVSHSIVTLYQQGWRKLRIAHELGVDVKTVRRHVRLAAKSLLPPTGDEGGPTPNSLLLPAGSLEANSPVPPAGPNGRASRCEPHRADIEQALERGLCAQRIYQDLVTEEGFEGGYDAVKRFVHRLRVVAPHRFHRFECGPGEEAQVDFGRGAPIRTADGRRQKTWVFRIVLSHSRKAYSEAVLRQTTESFIRCLENAFRYFGGVPKTLVIDNLRAAVSRADWFEPELNPKVAEFCRHYGTVILPARPYRPRDKGKVESSVKYVKNNALKAREFTSLAEENRYLLDWEQRVADQRIHGTTRRQVARCFEQERPSLLPLPATLFPCFQEARRSVHRDSFVEVGKAYYEVPEEYIQRDVWVRWDGRTVRVFSQRMVQIAIHAQRQPGQFSTQGAHIAPRKISGMEKGTAWLLRQVSLIGEHSERWAAAMMLERGIAGIRVLQGLIHMANRHDSDSIERACQVALTHRAFRLRAIRELIKRGGNQQEQFEFLQEHEIIRDLSSYGHIVRASLRQEPAVPEPVES